jgi:LmbE family N-acetylglucosaminyl deacetylase
MKNNQSISVKNKTILAVSAHPDDIEFACGGTLFKIKEQWNDIYLIVATNGENGFKVNHKPKLQRIKIRTKEQQNAADILGIKKVFFLNYKDCYLRNTDKLRKEIAAIIKKVKPDIIFSFDPANRTYESVNLLHRDHREISEAVFDAVFAARNRYFLKGNPHFVKQFWFFGCSNPNNYENITSYINNKINLIAAHKSQYTDYNIMSNWVKTHLSNYSKKYKYSEKFRIVNITKPEL